MSSRHTMKRTNVHLPKQQIEQLDRLSKKRGISRAEIVRRAIDAYVWGATGEIKETAPKRVILKDDEYEE